MIFQNFEARLFGIFIIQPILIIFFFAIAFRILYRNRNKFTITLSIFYILSAAGFTMNIIFLILATTLPDLALLLLVLYFTTIFLVLYSPIFILIFLIYLQKERFAVLYQLLIILLYGIGCSIILILPEGIIFITNWVPVFTMNFLIVFDIYFTLTIFFPIFYFLIKIYKTFEDKSLRKKFIFFSLGIMLMLGSIYGLAVYNAWHEPPIFRIIWSFVSLIVIPAAGLLIYYGIGQNL